MRDSRRFVVLLLLVLLVLGAGVTANALLRAPAAVDAPPEVAAAPETPPRQAPRPRVRAEDETAPSAASATTPAPSAEEPAAASKTAPAPVAAPTRGTDGTIRLPVTVVREIEARKPPPGVQVIPEGGQPVIPEPKGPVIGGGGGPVQVGWQRWHPVPAKGNVTWRGRVTDSEGRPVSGADVLRVALDERGERASPSSFQWVTKVATTAADGTFEATSQPDGSYLAAANWRSRMNRPRGLDLTGSVPVRGAGSDSVAGIELRLPVSVGATGGLRLTVRDADGAPVARAQVMLGYERVWTGADGRVEVAGIEPGTASISLQATGFAATSVNVEVVAGRVRDDEVRLELAVQGGLEIAGTVRDEDGRTVAGARLFLSDGSREGVRWATADAEGRYRFPKLPDAWSKRGVDVMVSPTPDRDLYLGDVKKDVRVPEPALDFVVQRLAMVKVLVRSTRDGAAIALFNLDVRHEAAGKPPRKLRSMSCYEEDGEVSFSVPRGRIVVEVEAKGHRPVELTFDVPPGDGPFEARFDLVAE